MWHLLSRPTISSAHFSLTLTQCSNNNNVHSHNSFPLSQHNTTQHCHKHVKNNPKSKSLRINTRTESSTSKLWDYLPVYDNLRYSTLLNGSLLISNVTQREQGYYICSAKNGFGPEMSKLIKITVHGKLPSFDRKSL